MSPMVKFTDKDLKRNTIVDPAWYVMMVDSVGEAPSSDNKSINYPVEGTIIKNADNGSEKFAGVPVGGVPFWMFNSKAIGFAKGFLECFGITVEKDQGYDLGGAEGKLIEVFIVNNTYNGRTSNRIEHQYRPHVQK